jgi:hypothetical protein
VRHRLRSAEHQAVVYAAHPKPIAAATEEERATTGRAADDPASLVDVDHDETKENYHMMERRYGSFQRSLRLPDTVDENKVEARFENGVLRVTLPKRPEAAREHRRIEIETVAIANGEEGAQSRGPLLQASTRISGAKPLVLEA